MTAAVEGAGGGRGGGSDDDHYHPDDSELQIIATTVTVTIINNNSSSYATTTNMLGNTAMLSRRLFTHARKPEKASHHIAAKPIMFTSTRLQTVLMSQYCMGPPAVSCRTSSKRAVNVSALSIFSLLAAGKL